MVARIVVAAILILIGILIYLSVLSSSRNTSPGLPIVRTHKYI